MSIERRLKELGLALPDPPKPAGNYVPWLVSGNLLFLSGQFPIENSRLLYTGRVARRANRRPGYAAARLAAPNVFAQIRTALGGFDRLRTLLRVEGHVASALGWNRAPRVLDGGSDLFASVLSERGAHTRAAFTPAQLPLNLAVELVVTAAIWDA